ncbi:hypothetical protein [Truepera radiovictrix]|uniref:Uncharacterized protein n=1 Tax=Truepera radiovictrix (strain DSM 17093 / CIP 108686 / LMG 22925 / RQ-24) TaxID=649638 RepID=D7CS54_TRURR|nr:hypothetical protein [Truepera radiovictrix]ADI13586.1 hypothetical protein Trad_0449 [Truepera radiovictrix DSM 17093]WMT57851.1 hypothetical protein RCV51_02610 [Truepera radiovictrix]
MLFLAVICFVLAGFGVLWTVRSFATKDKTPTERADLDKAGGIIFTLVSLAVGGVALYLYASGFLAPDPGLDPSTALAQLLA